MRWALFFAGCLVGCYRPPDFPLLDELPLAGPTAVCSPPREAQVACTVDGDTFDLGACGDDLGERVRLLGIDAPEVAKDGFPSDCFGDAASAELRRLIELERLTLTFDVECTDAFGRTLAYAWLTDQALDGVDFDPAYEDYLDELSPEEEVDTEPAILLNEWLLAKGFARLYPEEVFGAVLWQRRLDLAQQRAQLERAGLWAACEDEAP
jgi:endonuclease YncB( thermonuclease family)